MSNTRHRRCAGTVSLLALLTASWGASAIQTSFGVVDLSPRQLTPAGYIDTSNVEKIDPHSGSIRLHHQDLAVKGSSGHDIVVHRSYRPTMTYPLQAGEFARPAKDHIFKQYGQIYGWSISVTPKVILVGYSQNIGAPDYYLCTNPGASKPITLAGPDLKGWYQYDESYYPTAGQRVVSYLLEHVDGTVESFASTGGGYAETKSGWRLQCSGSDYVLQDRQGAKHYMNQRSQWADDPLENGYTRYTSQLLQATRVEDRNGNWHQIEYYDAFSPKRVTSNEPGVFVEFTYDPPPVANPYLGQARLLREVKDHSGRSVRYFTEAWPSWYQNPENYNNNFPSMTPQLSWAPGRMNLVRVELPEGMEWSYQYWGHYHSWDSYAECIWSAQEGAQLETLSERCRKGARSGLLKNATHPTGGRVDYDYRYSLPLYPKIFPWDYYNDLQVAGEIPQSYQTFYSSRVAKKTLSTGGEWRYSYQSGSAQGEFDVTTVSTPAGIETYKYVGFGNFPITYYQVFNPSLFPTDVWKLGLLVEKTVGSDYKESLEWTSMVLSSIWGELAGQDGRILISPSQTLKPLLSKRTILLNGASHITVFSNFDSFGNAGLVSESGPNGGTRDTTRTYVNDTSKWIIGLPKDETFADGATARSFDSNGNLLSETQDGITTSFSYDTQGNMTTKVLPRGLVHTYSNYKRGIAQTEAQPEGINIARVVDDVGNITSFTNGEGKTSTYAYDGLNRVKLITPPIGNATTITYTITSKNEARGGRVESTQYDGFGRPLSVNLSGIVSTLVHDAFGRMTFESNPGASIGRSYQYDALDRRTSQTNADGTFRSYAYGPGTVTEIDERGNATTYAFKSYGDPAKTHLMSITAPVSSASVAITRNGRDLITSVSQNGKTRSYGYDGNNYLTLAVNPEVGTTTYGRDAAGNMISRTVGASGATIYTYDGQNRLTSTAYPGATPAAYFSYDRTNRMLSATSSVANRSYGYDAGGNLTSETLVIDGYAFTAAYAYDGNDQLSSVTNPQSGSVVSYAPDVLGRPTSASGFISGIVYWPSGSPYQISYANGTVTIYEQNARLWPSSFRTQTAGGGAIYLNSGYAYDGVGNITSITDSIDSSYNRALGYDGINRLTDAAGPWGAGALTYTGDGNFATVAFGSFGLNYFYDGSNRLSSVSGSLGGSYGYDAYGNIASGSGNIYTYDDVPNLRCINCNASANKIEYSYDAKGQRVSVLKGEVKSYEMYDHRGNLLIEFTPGQSNKLIEYIYLGKKRVAQRVTP